MTQRQYSDIMLKSMQSAYGEGFLSPGAAEETHQMVDGLELCGKRLLDLGCGVGGASVLIAENYPVFEVTGVDVEDAQIAAARELASLAGVSNVSFKKISTDVLPFADNWFDIVIAKDVICHIPDKVKLFKELGRVLCPGGVCISADWHPGPNAEILDTWDRWMSYLAGGGLIFHFESAMSYEKSFIEAGFGRVEFVNHTAWSRQSAREQLELATKLMKEQALNELGAEAYEKRVGMTRARHDGLIDESVQHWHIHAYQNQDS